MIFTSVPCFFKISSMVGSTRAQNGHWKSEKCSITIFAWGFPRLGAGKVGAGTIFFDGGGGLTAVFIISA
jgi:hypothetical protein